jgi:DNA-binding helix-hairpin-helix protein with protein kinase domain
MPPPQSIRTLGGQPVALGPELGRGGEGIVYQVEGHTKLAAKLYHRDTADDRREKISVMVQSKWHDAAPNVAFPIDALLDASGRFIGFTMRRIGGHKPIHSLYSPTSRKTDFPKANFRFLVRVALNIARALATVNATGCVIGDINHSGILVSDDATVTLIDCDSFQVQSPSGIFRCKVGVAEFTPPELQGSRLDQVTRTSNHDSFGLAILLFSLLFMGRHPFAGRYRGKGDMPMEQAIAQFRFAYSNRKSETRMEPPPHVPSLDDLPRELGTALERSFGPVGIREGRPSPSEWVALLAAAEAQVVQCAKNSAHQHFTAAASCPWCAMENAYPGFLAFSTPFPSRTGTPVDLGQLLAAINAVPDPGISPALAASMPAVQASAPSVQIPVSKGLNRRYIGGLIAAVCSIELFYLGWPGPLVGAATLGVSIWVSFKEWDVIEPYSKAKKQLATTFQGLQGRYSQFSGNQAFLELKRDANDCIRQFQNLGSEETKRLADLKLRIREAQLKRFLERFYIEHARIKGIGVARKVTLRSYGIETAADVVRHRILQVSGFGPATTDVIVLWRSSIERKFVFDPTQPVNPADVAAIKADVAKRRIDLQTQLQNWLVKLRNNSDHIVQSREQIRVAAMPVWQNLKQAELNEGAIKAGLPSSVQKWAFGAVLLVGLVGLNSINSTSKYLPSKPPVRVGNSQQSNAVAKTEALPSQRDPTPIIINPSVPTAPDKTPTNLQPNPTVPVPDIQRTELKPGPEIESTSPNIAAENPPPIAPFPQNLIGMNNPQIVQMGQLRLRFLGFLKNSEHGSWDETARDALRNFKSVVGLPGDDVWDKPTQERLFMSSAPRADQTFIGAWSESAQCVRGTPDIVINGRQATSSAGGVCDFQNVRVEREGWSMKSKCSNAGDTWEATIRFSLRANRLIWNGRNGKTTYFRCGDLNSLH